jgi:phosphoribosyl 1,2-cyclic phosphate phosphodiesterase
MSSSVKVTFLGTGTSQGVPVIGSDHPVCLSTNAKDKRLRSSILVEIDKTNIVIDTGPDFRTQMLRENVQWLDAVLFTHEHKDHTAGLDDIRPFNFKQKRDMDVYGSDRVLETLKREFQYIFSEVKYPGVPRINLHEIKNKAFQIKGLDIIPIEVLHYKLPVFGYRFGDFTYITDANFISEKEKQKIKGTKVLVLNALRNTPHISHFTLDEAIALAKELEVEKAYFTHISHLLGFHDEVSAKLPGNCYLAYDGLQLEI